MNHDRTKIKKSEMNNNVSNLQIHRAETGRFPTTLLKPFCVETVHMYMVVSCGMGMGAGE
jgi:hypothetical protein